VSGSPGPLRSFLIRSTTTPARFILIWGVGLFGGWMAIATLVSDMPDVKHAGFAIAIVVHIVISAIAGLFWGSTMWLLIRWLRRRAQKRAERDGSGPA
jgi:hypothetical protein